MITLGGEEYYIDLTALDSWLADGDDLKAREMVETDTKVTKDSTGAVQSTETTTRTYHKGKEVDGAKFEVVNLMMQIVMSDMEPADTTLGLDRALSDKPLGYVIAFNTLISLGILVTK